MTTPLAVLVHTGHGVAEPLMQAFTGRVQAQGWRVAGLLQVTEVSHSVGVAHGGCQRSMELVDIGGGERYSISENLGPGSSACCLSAAGVLEASVVLRRALAAQPHLVVANRFGKLEAQGTGLRQEMAAIVEAGLPLLTAVDTTFLADWEAFSGGMAQQLAPSGDALWRWWQQVLAQSGIHTPVAGHA